MRILTATFMAACTLLAGGVAVPTVANAQATRPSFNCGAAKSEAERMICRDPALARMDREIAVAYAAALKRVNAAAAAKLRQEQGWFLTLRNNVVSTSHPFQSASSPRERIGDVMQARLEYLRAIRKPPSGALVTGVWVNYFGNMALKAMPPRRFEVEGSTVDPYAGRWTCEVEGIAGHRGRQLVMDERNNGGSLLEFSRAGDLLVVRETLAANDYVTPYCGHNGQVDGSYFYTDRK